MNNNYKHLDILSNHYDEVLSILDEHSQDLKEISDKYIFRRECDKELALLLENMPIGTSTSTLPFSGVWTPLPQ